MKKIYRQLISDELLANLPPSARKIYKRINKIDGELQEGWDRIGNFWKSRGVSTPPFPLDSKEKSTPQK